MPMSDDQLYCLFVNANSLAELALREAGAGLASMTAPTEPPGEGDLPEMSLDDLDFGALDGLSDLVDSEAEAMTSSESVDASQPPVDLSVPPNLEPPAPAMDTPSTGFDGYMAEAYAHRAELDARLAQLRTSVGDDSLDALVADLPDDLPPIVEPMDGARVAAWLERYMQHEPAITALVTAVRHADT